MAVIALAAGWNISQSENKAGLSDLALSNVEALARNEDPGDCIVNNCNWSSGETCHYTCNGQDYRSSNMKNKN